MTDVQPAPVTLESVDWFDPRAVAMRDLMDDEMHRRYANRMPGGDPETQARVDAALAVDPADIVAVVLALDVDGAPLGHAALRMLAGEWEVKRVIVADAARGRGVATAIMAEVQRLAAQGGARRLILQTGDRQPEAVRLYEKIGYTPIPIYEPYVEAIPFSLCFEKVVAPPVGA
ncbi:GNAT family N-acetyltransferase [Subtercola sp. YIM 133946]|uniref:GNAT family N-acetyltransferase n=1 Tax=Subtercola sp. YIM 133946 TaxID=3118909 RepID=UPI002F92F3F2